MTEKKFWYETDEHELSVQVTGEGVIMDVYKKNDQDVSLDEPWTVGMMFDEWIEWVIERDSSA